MTMRSSTYEALRRLHQRHGPREFGKLSQKLLAISFRLSGFLHVIERGVQGVDVDASDGRSKFATEVKTTLNDSVIFEAKDIGGLAGRRADGYYPVLGVLRLSPLSDWLLADAQHLEEGRLSLDRLRAYRVQDLEERLRPRFAAAILEHAEAAMTGGQGYLDQILRSMGIEQRDE
jgi:hypothetical protein